VINPHNVDADLAHHRKIDIHLRGPAEIMLLFVRLERPVGNAFDEKLVIADEKELCGRANS